MAAELPSVCSSEIRRRQRIRCPEQAPALDRPVHTWSDSWLGPAGPGGRGSGQGGTGRQRVPSCPHPPPQTGPGAFCFMTILENLSPFVAPFGDIYGAPAGDQAPRSGLDLCVQVTRQIKGTAGAEAGGSCLRALAPQSLGAHRSLCWEHPPLAPKAFSPRCRRRFLQEAFPDPPAP